MLLVDNYVVELWNFYKQTFGPFQMMVVPVAGLKPYRSKLRHRLHCTKMTQHGLLPTGRTSADYARWEIIR